MSREARANSDVDLRAFRQVADHLSGRLAVVTTGSGDATFGITSRSVTTFSMDPPTLLICLATEEPTAQAVRESGSYSVNILSDDQEALAHQFANPRRRQLRDVAARAGLLTGAQTLTSALARVDCLVTEQVESATHSIFLGRVVHVSENAGGPSSVFRGEVPRLEFATEDDAYLRARRLVLDRQYAPDTVLDQRDLAFDLQVEDASAVYALTRLVVDGLVRRDTARGYVVIPFDVRLSDETFDARCAIEVGAITTSLQSVPDDRVAGLRESFADMARQLIGDRFVDFDKYLDANFKFHQGIVMLAGNAALVSVFGHLGIKAVMTRSFGSTSASSQEFVDVQRAMLTGIEARDVAASVAAAVAYRDLAKARVRVILAQTGGRL